MHARDTIAREVATAEDSDPESKWDLPGPRLGSGGPAQGRDSSGEMTAVTCDFNGKLASLRAGFQTARSLALAYCVSAVASSTTDNEGLRM